jgi:hypothetical protein
LPPVYLLDSSDAGTFDTTVTTFACAVVDDFLNGRPIVHPCATVDEDHPHAITDDNYSTNANQIFRCDICNIAIQGALQWSEHLAGTKHKYQRGLLAKKQHAQAKKEATNPAA